MVSVPEECLMRWTATDVRRMVEAGAFERPERFELVEGLIVDKMGQNDPHIMAVMLATRAFRAVFGTEADVAAGIPLKLGEWNVPEPDLLVLSPDLSRPPTVGDARCVVEVSDTSLRKDQTVKAALYAQHGIPEYVILDVVNRCVEIRRKPQGESWGEILILTEGGEFTPSGASGSVRVTDLFASGS